MDFQAGQVLLFNKPKGWTSFDVVKKVRNTIRVKKVGHAGTLDPLATGLLILCTGKYTKRIPGFQDQQKEYIVTFKLGATTASYDAEFPEENLTECSHITQEQVEKAMETFVGEISQVPPVFSAVKVKGKRAYKLARKGEKPILKSRLIHIYQFSLTKFEGTDAIEAIVTCSKGTYIRTLVHDLGQYLGVGAYMTELVRTRIGDNQLENAWELSEFVQTFKKQPPDKVE